MRIFYTILCFIFCLSAFCQDQEQEYNPPFEHPEELKGKAKMTAFEKNALYYYDINFTLKAKESFNLALETAKNIQDTIGQLNALQGLFRIAFHKEDTRDSSLKYLGLLEEYSVETNSQQKQAYVIHHRGRLNKANVSYATERFKKALEIYEALEKKGSAAIVYRELGDITLDINRNEAFMYFQRSLEYAEEIENEEDIHLARSNISSALISMEQYEDARNFCEKNIEIAQEANDQDFLAYNYLLIGISYQKEKNYTKAIEYAKLGKVVCEANNLMDKKQYTYQLLKEIYNERGSKKDFSEAFDYFAKENAVREAIEQQRTNEKLVAINAENRLREKEKEIEARENVAYYKNVAKNVGLVGLAILVGILFMFNQRRRLKVQLQKEELEKLRVEQMLEKEERERLKERLEHKERELASNTMFTLQKNQMLSSLKEKIKTLKVSNDEQLRKQVKSLDRNIDMNMNFDDDWQKFKLHFDEVHPDFFERLHQENIALSVNETRFCAYIRMGLSTNEIAQLMGISASSVQKARYRLKKKLQLGKETNLINHIMNL